MYIESVKMLKTVKAGKRIFMEGAVLQPPLPKEILDEIIMNTGTVYVAGMPQKMTRQERYDFVYTPEMKTPDLKQKQLIVETETQGKTKVAEPSPTPQPAKKLLVQRRAKAAKGGKKK